jgi:hypothetical protein
VRCDLHVHSWFSGRAEVPVLEHVGRECYSDPLEVYERAVRRGMDLVTLTDHDTIEGALLLAHLPNAFVSEEVTVLLDGGRRQLHVNVFGIDERQHRAIQARRRDPEALFAWLAEQRVPAAVNHLFSALTGERTLADLRTGLTVPVGRSGSYARLTTEVARIFAAGYAETWRDLRRGAFSPLRAAASLAMAPFLPLIPLFTLGVYAHERRFGARHFRDFQEAFGWPALPSERPLPGVISLEEAA